MAVPSNIPGNLLVLYIIPGDYNSPPIYLVELVVIPFNIPDDINDCSLYLELLSRSLNTLETLTPSSDSITAMASLVG